jgi:hypothetical protein
MIQLALYEPETVDPPQVFFTVCDGYEGADVV